MAIIIRTFSRHRIRAIRWKKKYVKVAKVALQSPNLISQISSWIRTILSPCDFNVSWLNFGVIFGKYGIAGTSYRARSSAKPDLLSSTRIPEDRGARFQERILGASTRRILLEKRGIVRGDNVILGSEGWEVAWPDERQTARKTTVRWQRNDSIELQKSCDSTLRAREIKRLGGPFLGRSINFVENLHILWYIAKFLTTYTFLLTLTLKSSWKY